MKIGIRAPSPSKSFKARTTGKFKRAVKSSVNPLYGKKGIGLVNNPRKSVYGKIYHRTTTSVVPDLPSKTRPSSTAHASGGTFVADPTDTRPATPVEGKKKFPISVIIGALLLVASLVCFVLLFLVDGIFAFIGSLLLSMAFGLVGAIVLLTFFFS